MIPENPKILIIKTSSLGDIIHTFPAIAFLKKKFPFSTIDWVIEEPFAELVLTHPFINKVITIDTKKWRKSLFKKETIASLSCCRRKLQEREYDYAFDFQGNLKSGLVMALAKAKEKIGFGRQGVSELPNLLFSKKRFNVAKGINVRDENLFLVQSIFQDFSSQENEGIELKIEKKEKVDALLENISKPVILICPGAKWENKRLSFSQLRILLQELEDAYHPFFFLSWGSVGEKNLALELQEAFKQFSTLLPRLKLSELQYLMSKVSLVVAMDSLPLHLCGTTKTPSMSFFGPSSPIKYKPKGDKHLSIWGECPYKKGNFERRCPKLRSCKTGACIKEISKSKLSALCKSSDLTI